MERGDDSRYPHQIKSAELRFVHSNPALSPRKCPPRQDGLRVDPLLDRLSGASTVDIKAEYLTGDTVLSAPLADRLRHGRRDRCY